MKGPSRLAGAMVTVLLLQAGAAWAQDSLAAARQLYASAAYDEALAMLDRLKADGGADPAAAIMIEQYRAFCLLAVGRQSDAERAMESLVTGNPAFRPDEAISPRLQSVFRDVRRRTLPALVRQRYATARASFDEKDFRAAADQFDAVLSLLEAPEVVAADPALADLRTLALGFRDLAKAAAPPSPAPSVPAASSAPAPPLTRAYSTAGDPGVTAPIAIKQEVPPWPRHIPLPTERGRRAVLDLVIGENGAVESVAVRESIADWYDDLLIAAARRWSYKPATRDGVPVRYRRLMQVVVEK